MSGQSKKETFLRHAKRESGGKERDGNILPTWGCLMGAFRQVQTALLKMLK